MIAGARWHGQRVAYSIRLLGGGVQGWTDSTPEREGFRDCAGMGLYSQGGLKRFDRYYLYQQDVSSFR